MSSEHVQDNRPNAGLITLALAYLAIPNLIFIFGWFRWPVAALLTMTLVLLYRFSGIRSCDVKYSRRGLPFGTYLAVLSVSLAWAAFGGGSHFMHANHDWVIRDAVLGDLIFGDWPPAYNPVDGFPRLLRSAIGYFLLPALIGKLFGLDTIPIAVFLWTASGIAIFLSLLPLQGMSVFRVCASLLIVVFFSGADVLGFLVDTGQFPEFPGRIEWWSPYSYSSLTGQLLWAPNHALPIWIITTLLYRLRDNAAISGPLVTALPLTLIWTPFAIPGILPFILAGAVMQVCRTKHLHINWLQLAAALTYAVPILMFLTLDIHGIQSGAPASPHPSMANSTNPMQIFEYLNFVCFEVGLIALALFLNIREDRSYLVLAVLVLLVLPLFSYGPSNDALLRLSAPALTVLSILCIETMLSRKRNTQVIPVGLLVLVLAIGANTAINELSRVALFPRQPANYLNTLADHQNGPAPHYAGRLNNPWLMWMLATPHAVPSREMRALRSTTSN
jgi:hypothetical protein